MSYYGDGIATAAGGALGTAIGGPVGGSIGALLGKGAYQMFEALSGFGDYKVQQNSLMKGGMSPPMIMNSMNKGNVIIRHREYLGDISATTNFTNTSYALNPGLSSSFPWLSQVAASYEQYMFRGLVFEFKSTSSDAVLSSATSSALGTVSMATEYNVLNDNFGSLTEMLNYEYACSNKPSCERSQTPVSMLWLRSQPVPSDGDARLYDLGNFQIATSGMQAASGSVGQLWATYEVEFFKNKYNTGINLYTDHFRLATINSTNPLGSTTTSNTAAAILAAGNKWQLNGTVNTTSYFFPPTLGTGKFLVQVNWHLSSAQTSAITPLLASNTHCTVLQYFQAGSSGYSVNNATYGTATDISVAFILRIDAPNASFAFPTPGAAWLAAASSGDLIVTQIDSSVNC
jgi:hypothetical protein